jgi:hypothetical protein
LSRDVNVLVTGAAGARVHVADVTAALDLALGVVDALRRRAR